MTHRRPPRSLVLLLATAFVTAVIVADVVAADDAVLVGLTIVGPLAMGTVWGPRATALFSAPIVLVAGLQFLWNDNAGQWTYGVPLAVVIAGSSGAVAAAWMRRRAAAYAGQVTQLSGALTASEAQLEAILEHAGEAIMARRPDGSLLFANQAAADVLGLADPAEIESLSAEELMARFEVHDEQGREVSLADLPGTRILRGETVVPEMVVRNVDRHTGRERWLRNKATAVLGPDGRVTMAVNLVEDVTEAKRAEFVQGLLAEAGEVLSSSLDYERTLHAVAELAVPRLADWCAIDLPDAAGRVTSVAIVHRDPGMVQLARRLREEYPSTVRGARGAGAAIRTGESSLITEVTDEMLRAAAVDERHFELVRDLGLRSVMIVPMHAASGEALGAITLASSTSRRYGPDDLRLAEELGHRAGVAVENARLYGERGKIAHTLQSALLPPAMPELERWELATRYRPAGALNEVGGDFYDAVRMAEGWAVVIGDVAGKGATAASLTALARHTLHSVLELTGSPRQALAYLNERLNRRPELSLTTAAILVLPDVGDAVEIVSAGHPLPLLAGAGGVQPVGAPWPLLGGFEARPEAWSPRRVKVAPGDRLLLFTDGVPDAPAEGEGRRRERFGEERLHAVVGSCAGAGAADLVAAVDGAVTAFSEGARGDDVALVALRRR